MKLGNRLLFGAEDERGIAVLRGHLRGYAGSFCVVLGALLIASITTVDTKHWYGMGQFTFTVCAILLPGAIFLGVGYWVVRLWWHTRKLRNLSYVAARLGVQEEELKALAEARGIRPRFKIEEQDYYSASDFDDALILLRPAVAGDHETLLRLPECDELRNESLLRAAHLDIVPD